MKITVSMITLNEERNIARALSSCTFADEIVVVDGGSKDGTLEILRSSDKVNIIQHPWEGHFGNQRQESLRYCTGDWIVRLDADEAFSQEFEEKIRDLLKSTPADVAGYNIRQCNLIGDTNYYSKNADNFEPVTRIWRNADDVRWENAIHEVLVGISGRIIDWDIYVIHYGFLDRQRYRGKGEYYSSISGSRVKKAEDLLYREYNFQPVPERTAVAPHVIPYYMDECIGRKPGIAIIRGPNLNLSEIRNYSTLLEKFEITAYTTAQSDFDESNIKVPIVRLPYDQKHPTYMTGLEFAVFDKNIIFTADITWLFTQQAVMAKQKFGNKVIALASENIPFAHEEDEQIRALKQENRKSIDVFVAVTERAKDALLVEGVPEDKITVIPMGIDVDRFRPDTGERMRLRKEFGIADEERVVLFAGRMVWEKGIYDLLYAAKMIDLKEDSKSDKTKFVVVGEGPEAHAFISRLQEMGIERMFTFYSHKNMYEMFNIADIFVMPSISTRMWKEQVGMILLEAMACGLPIISTASGSIPDVVGDAGVLVHPNDPRDLSVAIMKLLKDDNFRKTMSARGRERAVEVFAAEKTAHRIGILFERLCRTS